MYRSIGIVLLLALAGCTDDGYVEPDGPDADGESGDAMDGAMDGEESMDGGGNATNLPPVGQLVASIANGTTPYRANLTLNGTDPEGQNLTGGLSSESLNLSLDGLSLPAQLNVTVEAEGNHTIDWWISDGNHTINGTLQLVGLAAPAGAYQFASGGIDGESGVCQGAPDTGTGKVTIEIDAATWDVAYSLTFNAGAAYDSAEFRDASGGALHRWNGGLTSGGWATSGNVPSGSATLVLWACGNTFGETYTYEAGTPP